ncbi:hypothetical protein [Oceaniglobus trochenteri]|uniref:hypothetical protein n=1 Tax=Oceaniglobus trochenteri TaxID=2763260 RepID=UPI001CFF801E|nr:hypothetical protein [Oceaniglobus trochenteri]
MEIEKSDVWQRHQLATVERMQRDLACLTHPVIRAVGLCGVAFLASWAVVMVLGANAELGPMTTVVALSAAVVVLGTPAFALAVAIERYMQRRSEGSMAKGNGDCLRPHSKLTDKTLRESGRCSDLMFTSGSSG